MTKTTIAMTPAVQTSITSNVARALGLCEVTERPMRYGTLFLGGIDGFLGLEVLYG